ARLEPGERPVRDAGVVQATGDGLRLLHPARCPGRGAGRDERGRAPRGSSPVGCLGTAGSAGRGGGRAGSPLRGPLRRRSRPLVPEEGMPESPDPGCSSVLRVLARIADLGLAYGLSLAAGRAGLVVALLYLLLADGMFRGQSVGKRIFGVKAVYLPTRTDARFRDSTLRNAPLALVVLLRMMPEPLGLRAGLAGCAVIVPVDGWEALGET